MATTQAQTEELPWFLKTSYPVLFPSHEALFIPYAEYDSFLVNELRGLHRVVSLESLEDSMDGVTITAEEKRSIRKDWKNGDEKYFNLMLTENADVAFRSTKSPVVDLFYELEDVVSGPRLKELLDAAWAEQPLATLKIIFNARSIHLGKSSKHIFYRAAGWLAEHHPLTLVGNLRWLSRPVIEKKVRKEGEKEAEEGFVKVEKRDGVENAVDRYDVRYGVSHGYWKDLLNILALAAEKKLNVLENPRDVLNVEDKAIKSKAIYRRRQKQNVTGTASSGRTPKRIVKTKKGQVGKKEQELAEIEHALEEKTAQVENPNVSKHEARDSRREALQELFDANAFYRTLHITVARLFAEQLHADLEALRGSDPKAKRGISLCAKWTPSHGNFHDRHTCIISSIAEILYPRESLGSAVSAATSREVYLRYAREQYRKDISALRKHLEVVERDISANAFDKIKYDRVPSMAMKNYTSLFVKKDLDHFREYINKVAEGKARISGAVLMPSTLIRSASGLAAYDGRDVEDLTADELVDRTVKEIESKAINGQWKALVQRIKDSGTLSSCIAVCDVSGSMGSPTFSDRTTPMDSAVGLSLLVAEVTEPPFGGNFISFHSHPRLISIDVTKTLREKVAEIKQSNWGYNTDFVAVFEKLILPAAIEKNLKQEDMVKRVFVFSDMQFDEANSDKGNHSPWSMSSYERIKKKYEKHGYEMPELVFWNLAGGRAGYNAGGGGDETAPKPVLAEEMGTAMVSGYSQGMLKVFMDNGMFDEADEEEEEEDDDDDDSEKMDEEGNEEKPEKVEKKKEKKINPLMMVKKAISHKGYAMLEVLD